MFETEKLGFGYIRDETHRIYVGLNGIGKSRRVSPSCRDDYVEMTHGWID
jgi:hypothetical protein